MTSTTTTHPAEHDSFPSSLSLQALTECLVNTSNADLLGHAAHSDDPLTRELAVRYEAALAFLHKDNLHFITPAT
ncbi:hypothetical protein BJN45_16730 [Azonexus hydrophilus]|uniref:Uncharacterized protein n=1 Tax=Azonexus hydrophilus TaxID=418702 RepID=A0A1R1HZX5_9RHOO|nr:hypothetical protein [Azonexus hydrophilus]OMG51864.1 hypothetical protein BJN45_16730 [Azonexus hydrophilus]